MAKVIENFEFYRNSPKGHYKWDEWLDGQIWELTEGLDYFVSIGSFRVSILKAAKKRGIKARTSATPCGIVIQALKNPGPEGSGS